MRKRVVLPEPFGPSTAMVSVSTEVGLDAAQHVALAEIDVHASKAMLEVHRRWRSSAAGASARPWSELADAGQHDRRTAA